MNSKVMLISLLSIVLLVILPNISAINAQTVETINKNVNNIKDNKFYKKDDLINAFKVIIWFCSVVSLTLFTGFCSAPVAIVVAFASLPLFLIIDFIFKTDLAIPFFNLCINSPVASIELGCFLALYMRAPTRDEVNTEDGLKHVKIVLENGQILADFIQDLLNIGDHGSINNYIERVLYE